MNFTNPISPRLRGFRPLSRESRFVHSRSPSGLTDRQPPPGITINALVPSSESNSRGALAGRSKASKLNENSARDKSGGVGMQRAKVSMMTNVI